MTCPTCARQLPPPFSPPPSLQFSELFSTNAPPLDDEVSLRQIIQDSSVYIDSVQSQIVKVQETLSALKGLQENASRIMADAKIILHPMRSLPHDILAKIFLCCTPIVDHHEINWAVDGDNIDSLSPLNHPWNISHVSHRWREIALSLPRLWSVIYLNFYQYIRLDPQQCSFMGSLLFERSAKLDLCINIASGPGYIDFRGHSLMPLLKESTTRWRTVYAHMSPDALQSLSGCEFPLLQELGVRNEMIGDYVSVDTFRNVQNVTIMHLYPNSETGMEAYTFLGDFPWSKLSKLSCSSFKLQPEFVRVLQQSNSLTELTLSVDIIVPWCWRELSGNVIILPALTRLDLTNCGLYQANIENILQILHLPSICCFTVTFATSGPLHYSAVVPHPDFHRISSLHVTCSMTKLSNQLAYIGGSGTLLNLLRPMSGVVEFRLADDSVTAEFLDGLVAAEKGEVLLPSLTTLDLYECGFNDHDEALKLLRRIVESRSLNHGCSSLEKIVLPQEDWLNESIADGVDGIMVKQSYH